MALTLFFALQLTAQGSPVLSISGSCPGTGSLTVTDLTPGANLAILAGSGSGTDRIPRGPCTGTETGLTRAQLVLTREDTDADGVLSLRPSLTVGACDRVLQVLDLESCEVSESFDMLSLVGGSSAITPGDTITVVTFIGGLVYDPDTAVWDDFGAMDFRCAEWDGDTCIDFQTRVGMDECSTYPNSDEWHTNLYVNDSETRNCRLICQATTGNDAWDECSGGASISDAYWGYSWSQRGTECSTTKYLWRTQDVSDQCEPWCLNIAQGNEYEGSPALRVQCSDW